MAKCRSFSGYSALAGLNLWVGSGWTGLCFLVKAPLKCRGFYVALSFGEVGTHQVSILDFYSHLLTPL